MQRRNIREFSAKAEDGRIGRGKRSIERQSSTGSERGEITQSSKSDKTRNQGWKRIRVLEVVQGKIRCFEKPGPNEKERASWANEEV